MQEAYLKMAMNGKCNFKELYNGLLDQYTMRNIFASIVLFNEVLFDFFFENCLKIIG